MNVSNAGARVALGLLFVFLIPLALALLAPGAAAQGPPLELVPMRADLTGRQEAPRDVIVFVKRRQFGPTPTMLEQLGLPVIRIAALTGSGSSGTGSVDTHNDAPGLGGGTLITVEECGRRWSGRGGQFLRGPLIVPRTLAGLGDLSNADALQFEYCWSTIWGWDVQNFAPLNGGFFVYSDLRVSLLILVNGLVFQVEDIRAPSIGGELAPYDPSTGPFGPWTSAGLGPVAQRGAAFTIPLTDQLRQAFATPFVVTVIASASAFEQTSGGVHGASEFYWTGGLDVAAVVEGTSGGP